ncbi:MULTISPECIES: hypothetical protein [unclassified Knoellia]|uniref:hypothetical protein n=1 Tax=Knoellia altitudinis TaxID=3404795 RepID=UPI00360D6DB0
MRTVEAEVRELIRRSGLDPARDPKAVQRLVRDAVADYDQRSVHGGMPVLVDVARAEKSVWDTVAGFGPLQQYFDDPTVEEIWINDRLAPGWASERSRGSSAVGSAPPPDCRSISVFGCAMRGVWPSLWSLGRSVVPPGCSESRCDGSL